MMSSMEDKLKAFERLLIIMDELREKCPWDREQTIESIRNLTIEETYELADAILQGDKQEIKKELGDLLLHIVFYAKIGSETQDFDIASIADSLSEKLIRRHPHVYGDENVDGSTKKVKENWEQIKQKEKDGNKTVLSGVPKSLPSMIKAARIQEKVSGVGFDWEEREQVWEKVKEEIFEVDAEIQVEHKGRMEAEFGDLFFSLINAARLYGIDPETALERTNQKFTSRFNYLESQTLKKGKDLKQMSLDEMNKIWEAAKKFDASNNT